MDFSWQKILVLATAVVFAGSLLWKSRPRLPLPSLPKVRRSADNLSPEAIKGQVREAREKARAAKTPRDRAMALHLAAEAAAKADDGMTSAMGLYLRAMRADATFCDPVRGISALLRGERPELLETVLWRRLANVSFSGENLAAVKGTVDELGTVYWRGRRLRGGREGGEKPIARRQ